MRCAKGERPKAGYLNRANNTCGTGRLCIELAKAAAKFFTPRLVFPSTGRSGVGKSWETCLRRDLRNGHFAALAPARAMGKLATGAASCCGPWPSVRADPHRPRCMDRLIGDVSDLPPFAWKRGLACHPLGLFGDEMPDGGVQPDGVVVAFDVGEQVVSGRVATGAK